MKRITVTQSNVIYLSESIEEQSISKFPINSILKGKPDLLEESNICCDMNASKLATYFLFICERLTGHVVW